MRRNEPVSKIMTASPATAHHGMPLSEVRGRMAELGCHHLPVVSGSKLLGMVTSTDVLRVSYDYGQPVAHANAVLDNTRTLEDIMQSDLTTVTSHTTIREAAEVLAKNAFHALPVVDNEQLVGIVTTTDLLRYLLEQY